MLKVKLCMGPDAFSDSMAVAILKKRFDFIMTEENLIRSMYGIAPLELVYSMCTPTWSL